MSTAALDLVGLAEIAARRIKHARRELAILDMIACLDLTLDDWQRAALTSDARQMLLNVTRQGGKSTVASLMGLHEILTVPDSLVLVISPGERQSKLLFRKMLGYYKTLTDAGFVKRPAIENKLSLELHNGAQVHALPGDENTIRGFSGVTLLLIDEASRVADDMEAAVRPMLAVSGGRLVAMSTPWGKRGWWYHAWDGGGADWQRYEVPATACPRIKPEFLERERRALPQLAYESEYLCRFVEPDDAAFSYESIARAFDSSITPLFPVAESLMVWT